MRKRQGKVGYRTPSSFKARSAMRAKTLKNQQQRRDALQKLSAKPTRK